MLRPHILGWFLVLCVLVPQWTHGAVPAIAAQVQGITDSARAKMLAHLARGELAEAVQAYEGTTGLKAPLWLTGVKAAFDTSKQVDRAYDAYTGASGLPWAEYMSRLGARAPITEKVVEVP